MDMSWPVVEEMGEEEIMDESRHTEAEMWGWGATSAILPGRLEIVESGDGKKL